MENQISDYQCIIGCEGKQLISLIEYGTRCPRRQPLSEAKGNICSLVFFVCVTNCERVHTSQLRCCVGVIEGLVYSFSASGIGAHGVCAGCFTQVFFSEFFC